VLSPEKNSPGNAARVLALEEQRFGFAILESEDLAIATDVELSLYTISSAFYASSVYSPIPKMHLIVAPSFVFRNNATEFGSARTFPG
jgi:hypothetical protein